VNLELPLEGGRSFLRPPNSSTRLSRQRVSACGSLIVRKIHGMNPAAL
jgi:hypothetical protein